MVALGQAVRGGASAVEQIGKERAIARPRDVLEKQPAELTPKFPVMAGMGEGERAGDHLAPRVALACLMRRATRGELATGFALIVG
jgi:hypothetical protein